MHFTVAMSVKEYKELNSHQFEYTDEAIRRKLVNKYNAYYRHWRDLNFLVALLAMIGLFLAIR